MRVNRRIRVPQVRVVGADGEQIGILATHEALAMAEEKGLDLVEVAANARPPVCRIMDYGKFKFEQSKRARVAKKKQHVTHLIVLSDDEESFDLLCPEFFGGDRSRAEEYGNQPGKPDLQRPYGLS